MLLENYKHAIEKCFIKTLIQKSNIKMEQKVFTSYPIKIKKSSRVKQIILYSINYSINYIAWTFSRKLPIILYYIKDVTGSLPQKLK